MHQFRLFLILVLFNVAGCVSYQADPLDGERELIQLRDRDLQHFVVERAGDTQPTDSSNSVFDATDGLDEAEIISVALVLNPELRARRASLGEAEAALISAGLWPNPEFGFGWRPGIDGASGYMLDADLLFEILRPGERYAEKNIVKARAEEVRIEIVAEEFRLVGEVRTQRLNVFAANRAVSLFQETVDLRQRALELVRRQQELGEATSLDRSASELELAQARRELRQVQVELSSELLELNRLLGLPPSYDLHLTGFGEPLTFIVYDDVEDQELDRRLMAGRLELRAKEAEYTRAEEELRLAVLGQYPRFGIGPAFERELEGSKSLGLGLSLELPLFNQNQGEIAEKRAARERTRIEYSALLHQLRADAFAARASVRSAKAEVESQEKDILPLLRQNQDLFEGAYRAREINIIDWLTSQQRAVDARREYLEALVQYRKAVIALETTLGQAASSAPTTVPSTQPNQVPAERN